MTQPTPDELVEIYQSTYGWEATIAMDAEMFEKVQGTALAAVAKRVREATLEEAGTVAAIARGMFNVPCEQSLAVVRAVRAIASPEPTSPRQANHE